MAMSEEWWNQVFENDVGVATRIVQSLQAIGVKVMAFDFDRTIIDFNTGGKWKKSVERLARHVRPCMRDLIDAALANPNISVSIVTYSIQPDLIGSMLKTVYPNRDTSKIIIAANPNKIKPQLTPAVYKNGKEKHIEDVCKLFEAKQGQKVKPEQIILFDDRKRYCQIAEESGHLAFTVNPDVNISQIQNYVDQQASKRQSIAPVAAQNNVQPLLPVTMVAVLPRWPERQNHSTAAAIFEKSAADRHLDAFPRNNNDHNVAQQMFVRSEANRQMYDHPYNAPLPNLQQLLPPGYAKSQAVVVVNRGQ